MESEPHAAGNVRRSSRWLPEAVLIIVSVALGFAVAQFGEYRGDRRLTARMLTSIEAELEHMQEITTDNVDRLATGALSATATYDPASREASVKLLWLTLADIQSAEALLLDLYRQHLPAIKSAADDAR